MARLMMAFGGGSSPMSFAGWAPPQLVRTPDVSSPVVRPSRIARFIADSRTASPYLVPAAVAAGQIAARSEPVLATAQEDDDPYSEPVE